MITINGIRNRDSREQAKVMGKAAHAFNEACLQAGGATCQPDPDRAFHTADRAVRAAARLRRLAEQMEEDARTLKARASAVRLGTA